MWEENFATQAGVHLIEGVRLIWGSLNTGLTVFVFLKNLLFHWNVWCSQKVKQSALLAWVVYTSNFCDKFLTWKISQFFVVRVDDSSSHRKGQICSWAGRGGVGGSDKAAPPCFCASLLSKVISGAVNFERLTNICRTMYKRSIYLSQKNFLCGPGFKSYHDRSVSVACCFQGVTLGAGLIITFVSFVLVYFINKKADLIFTPTDPPSSALDG